MTGRTDHEQELSARVAKLPTASQAALLKILARTATRQMESAYALLDDLGMAPASEDGGEADHTAEQDAADFAQAPAEDQHTTTAGPVPLRAVPPSPPMALEGMLQPAGPPQLGQDPCGDEHAPFICTAFAGHGPDLDHTFHDDEDRAVAVWPATVAPPAMGHLAVLAPKLAERAGPGAGGM